MSDRLLISFQRNLTDGDEIYDFIYTDYSSLDTFLTTDGQYFMALFPYFIYTVRDKELLPQFKRDFETALHEQDEPYTEKVCDYFYKELDD